MALSSYDTLSVDLENKSVPGYFESDAGIVAEFYKNWIYLHDKKMWREGIGFSKDTICEIHYGVIKFGDLNIWAKRGPKDSICAFIWSGWEHDGTLKGIAGISLYGYDEDNWVGVEKADAAYLEGLAMQKAGDGDIPMAFAKLNLESAQRFNQGDAFFAANLLIDLPMSEPGKADLPLLLNWKNK